MSEPTRAAVRVFSCGMLLLLASAAVILVHGVFGMPEPWVSAAVAAPGALLVFWAVERGR